MESQPPSKLLNLPHIPDIPEDCLAPSHSISVAAETGCL